VLSAFGCSSSLRLAEATRLLALLARPSVHSGQPADSPPSSVGRARGPSLGALPGGRGLEPRGGCLSVCLAISFSAFARQAAREASRGFEPRPLHSESRALTVTQMHRLPLALGLSFEGLPPAALPTARGNARWSPNAGWNRGPRVSHKLYLAEL
jgi:hypothetical protein